MNARPTFALLAFCIAFAACGEGAAPFVLASGGRSRAVIVPYGGDTNGVGYAANLLADYLGKIAETHFLVADKPVPGYGTILVGAPYKAARPEELCVRVKDAQTLEVTGDGARGAVHAVMALVESLGVVVCAHDYEHVPHQRELALPGDYAQVDAPAMLWREAWSELQRSHFDYMMKLRLDPNPVDPRTSLFMNPLRPTIGQTVCNRFISKRTFFKDHPEWYAYVHATGQRNPHWVCVSNEEMLEQLYKEIDAFIAEKPGRPEVAVGVDDGARFCECDKCLALLKKYPDPDGSEVAAVQYVVLANKVGAHFRSKYPGIRFNFLGYGERLPASPDIVLEPNVGGGVAELWRNHGLPADCNERSAYSLGHLARLSRPDMGPYVWDYLANYRNYMLPFPNHRIFAQTVRYYRSCGVKGVLCQHQWTPYGNFSEMKMWLFAKLLWNPDADVDELIDTYVNATYGRAAKEIRAFLDILEHARLRQRWTWMGCYVHDTSHYLTDEDCVKLAACMERAMLFTRGDYTCGRMVRRARIAALDMTLARYNDMIAPAARLRFKLRPREEVYEDWKSSIETEYATGSGGEPGENASIKSFRRRYDSAFESPAEPTVYPRAHAVVRAAAAELTGGTRMEKGEDTDGVGYARFHVDLRGERERIWMNPSFAEVGWTIADEDAGWWYVFADVRVDTTVDHDPAAAYLGIYQPWYINAFKAAKLQEVANRAVSAEKGETAWRTLCLGRRRLYPESRIWLMPGILHQSAFCDLRGVTLLDPALVEGSVPAPDAAAKSRSRVIGPEAFARAANMRLETDKIDGFRYARLAAFATNAPVEAIRWTVPADCAGHWHVLLTLRSGASVALDSAAAWASVAAADGAITRTRVSGSLGDESWQIVSLGELDLAEGMKISLEPGTNAVPRYTDLRRITLLDPAFIGSTQPALDPAP